MAYKGNVPTVTNTNHLLPKGTSDEHYTPKELFEALGLVFDLDVAAPIGGNSCVPCSAYFDKNTDGLTSPWYGNVWMNPPYSKPTPWVDKFIEHGKGIALLPITRGQWWHRIWQAADIVLPLAYNFKFLRPEGLPAKPIVFQTALYGLGEENVEAIKRLPGRHR